MVGLWVVGAEMTSSLPMRVIQQDRLWPMTLRASQAAFAPNRPDGRWFGPAPYLSSRTALSTTAWLRCQASRAVASPSMSVMNAWYE